MLLSFSMVETLSPLICFPVLNHFGSVRTCWVYWVTFHIRRLFCCFHYFVTKSCPVSYILFVLDSSALIDNMMTRGKSRVPVALVTSTASGTRPQKRPAKSSTASKRASRSKRARTTAASPVTETHPLPEVAHPSQLEWVPLASAQPVQQYPPLPDVAAIISGAVIKGLKVAGIFLDALVDSSQEDSNQAATVQGSVAAVIQNITGEQNSPSVNQNTSYVTNPNVSVVCDPLVGAIDRPKFVHKPLAVPLASRISDKIQSKIWANEYVDFGTLLRRSYANDSKYNFVVQAFPLLISRS